MTVVIGPATSKLVAEWFQALIVWTRQSHRNAAIVLVVTSLLAFIPGMFGLPPIDRDEARFAQATKQMIESGDFIDIRFQDESRYKKPVGIYWLQAGVVKAAEAVGVPAARTKIWLYRVPSIAGAVAAVLLTYWTALAFVSRSGALFAGLMMASSILLGIEARLAKTDAVMLATVVAAMGVLGHIYMAERRGRAELGASPALPVVFWTAIAIGILVKGPLVLMIVGLSVVTLVAIDRSGGWLWRLRPLAGIGWTLALVLPWFVAIVVKSGDGFFQESLGRDLLAKVASGQEAHWGPPGLYFLLFWATFFPGSILAGMAAPAIWRARREPETRFLLAWIVPTWIVFELAVTKLPHYVLPVYPAIAILTAGALTRGELSVNPWLRRGASWWFVTVAALALFLIGLNIMLGQRFGPATWLLSFLAVIAGLFAWWLFDTDGPAVSFLRAVVASILISAAAFSATFAHIDALFPARPLARVALSGGCDKPAVASVGFNEPSLVFLVGTQLQHADAQNAADFLAQGGRCRVALVEARHERAFLQRADAIGLRYGVGPRIEGYNYSIGRSVSVATFMGVGP